MADMYEVVLTMDLGAGISEAELAELRWHLGTGPRPDVFPIGTDRFCAAIPLGDPGDPDCEWEMLAPEPLFARRGVAHYVGGALVAELVGRSTADGWGLTVRQELHPDSFYQLRALLDWLGRHARHDQHVFAGYLRFYEEAEVVPVLVRGGMVVMPEPVEAHTPELQS